MPPSSNELRTEARFDDSFIGLFFSTQEGLGGFFEEARRHQAFMLRLDQEPEPFTTFTFTAQVGGGTALTFHAALVQTFPGDGAFEAAFQLTDWNEALALVMKAHSSR